GAAPDLVEAADRVRLDDGNEGRLRGRVRPRTERPCASGRRRGLPAGGGARRARAARGGRAARQDRPPHPGVAPGRAAGIWLTRLPGAPKPPPTLDASGVRVMHGDGGTPRVCRSVPVRARTLLSRSRG